MARKFVGASEQQSNQPRQVREVSGDRDVSCFATQTIADPLRRIVGLDITDRSELRQRVARAAEHLGRLFRAQLAAVPDDVRLRAEGGGFRGNASRAGEADCGQRPARVLVRADRNAVMHEIETHSLFSP